MSNYRQFVQDYVQASEALLKMGELTDNEMEVVQQMTERVSEKLLNDGES